MELVIIAKDISWKIIYEIAMQKKEYDAVYLLTDNGQNQDEKCITLENLKQKNKENTFLVIASCDPVVRRNEFLKWKNADFKFATLIDNDCFAFRETKFGEGVIVCKGVIIYPDSAVKDNVLLMPYSSVSHDSIVEKNTVVMEKTTLGGHGIIGENTYIGPMSVVKENINIGSNVFVDSGTVILKNVSDDEKVRGNPARKIRQAVTA